MMLAMEEEYPQGGGGGAGAGDDEVANIFVAFTYICVLPLLRYFCTRNLK